MGRLNKPAITWPKKSLIILVSIGVLLLTSKPPTIIQAQGPCGGRIDMLDYMLPDDPSHGNRMSNGDCFYTSITSGNTFYIVKSCSNGIWFEKYAYDNNWIYIIADTTWTDRCPGGSPASGIYSGSAGEPGARRYPRCVSDPGAGGTTPIAPAQGCVEGLSKTTCAPCDTAHSGCFSFNQTLTHNADGTITINVPDAGESYTYDDQYGWVGFDGPTGDAARIGDSEGVEPDEALLECVGPPSPETCFTEFPEDIKCCPIKQAVGPVNWFKELIARFGGSILDFIDLVGIANINFTLVASGDLDRSEQLPADADYFWASFEERYDPRRIPLPDEEPEDNGMWGGVAMRIAPPDYRPPAMWNPERERRLKWEIPLDQYEVESWWGDGGKTGDRNRSAHHPLMRGATDAWEWFIRTPGLEERIASSIPPTAFEINPSASLGTNRSHSEEPTNSPTTTPNNSVTSKPTYLKSSSNSPQTLGAQLAQAEDDEICLFISINCGANNWNVHCDVVFSCLVSQCGHYYAHLNGEMIGHGNCTPAGALHWDGSVDSGTDSATFTATLHGDPAECKPGPAAPCTINFDTSGGGSCTASAGSPCGAPPDGGADICNPPYPATDKNVCSDTDPRPVSKRVGLSIIIDHYINTAIELFPEFTWLETISYRLAGISNEKYSAYREAGVGGVFDLFLPPDETPPEQQKFPTLDAPAFLGTVLKINVNVPCEIASPLWPLEEVCEYTYRCCSNGGCRSVDGCGECVNGEECRVTEDCKCCFKFNHSWCIPTSFAVTVPLESKDGFLRIRYVGSQTEALRQTQQWLAPPL